jgi:hypothetical protein
MEMIQMISCDLKKKKSYLEKKKELKQQAKYLIFNQ